MNLQDKELNQTATDTVLIVGASSLIAKALAARIADAPDAAQIITVSRQARLTPRNASWSPASHFQSDYSDESIADICCQLETQAVRIKRVFICNGILHDGPLKPEKRVEDIQKDNLQAVFNSNAVTPMLWLKYLKPLLASKQECVVTVFSARIGSVEDNRRGGWYAYRASKAALNMFVKTAAIEYARSAKGVRFLVFHPGTTDTPLSKPFQKFVDEGKLFTPDFVAQQLLGILDTVAKETAESNIQFLDWQGQKIPW